MIYGLFALLAVLSTAVIAVVASRAGVVDIGKGSLYKPCEETVTPFRGKSLLLLTTVCLAATFVAQISLYKNAATVNFVKLYGLLLLVFLAGVIDAKRRIIPNALILVGLAFRAGIYLYEIFFASDLKSTVINDLIGFGLGFLFLGLVSLVTKGALGFGDVKLFGVIGLISGSFCTYSTLFLSLVISAVASVALIARKKMGRKGAFPFGPCIAAGYFLVILLTSY